MADSPDPLVDELIALLRVSQTGEDSFLGMRKPGGVGRVFGGQVVAQALSAGQATVAEDRIAHSLHAYFMRGGSEDHEIAYQVTRDFDGGSFSTRRIVASQQDRPIFTMTASFQKLEGGLAHQAPMPEVPGPEDLPTEAENRARYADLLPEKVLANFLRDRPVESRPVVPRDWLGGDKRVPAIQNIWFRVRSPLPDDPALHRAALAYASDHWLLGTSTLPHGITWHTPGFSSASLDHAVWLHDEVKADDWLLYAADCPWTGRGRGFNRGSIYAQDGRLIATCAQEGMVRVREVKA